MATAPVVGTWEVTINVDGRPPSKGMIRLNDDGSLEVGLTPPQPDAEIVLRKCGTWSEASGGKFILDMAHPKPDEREVTVRTQHQVHLPDENTWQASGQSSLEFPDGTTRGPTNLTVTGKRLN